MPSSRAARLISEVGRLSRIISRILSLRSSSSWIALRRVEHPDLSWFRDLYRRVGEEWLWFSRARMSDAELAAIIQAPGVEIHALVHDGRDEGLLELDFRQHGQCELVFFGVTANLIGTGAARFLMKSALAHA